MCVDGRCRQTLSVLTQSLRALSWGDTIRLFSYAREHISLPLSGASSIWVELNIDYGLND